jgi:hypothetical protein
MEKIREKVNKIPSSQFIYQHFYLWIYFVSMRITLFYYYCDCKLYDCMFS